MTTKTDDKAASNLDSKLEKARKKFEQTLPKRITCANSKCGKSRKRELFGVRLMNRNEVETQGAEPKFRVQSYCKECRH